MNEPITAGNFDERMNRLAERHEALAQTVEHMALQGEEQNGRITRLLDTIEKLARIVESHEHRIDGFEGRA